MFVSKRVISRALAVMMISGSLFAAVPVQAAIDKEKVKSAAKTVGKAAYNVGKLGGAIFLARDLKEVEPKSYKHKASCALGGLGVVALLESVYNDYQNESIAPKSNSRGKKVARFTYNLGKLLAGGLIGFAAVREKDVNGFVRTAFGVSAVALFESIYKDYKSVPAEKKELGKEVAPVA